MTAGRQAGGADTGSADHTAFTRFLRASLTPMIAVNCTFMLAAGVFIVFRGQWQGIWIPCLLFFISPIIFPLMILPSAIFSNLMRLMERARPVTAKVMQAMALASLAAALALWSAFVFKFIGPQLTGTLLVPGLVWAVAASAGPWAVFARGDRDNVLFTGYVLMLQAAAIVTALLNAAMPLSFWDRFGIIWGLMFLGAGIQAAREELLTRKQRKSA